MLEVNSNTAGEESYNKSQLITAPSLGESPLSSNVIANQTSKEQYSANEFSSVYSAFHSESQRAADAVIATIPKSLRLFKPRFIVHPMLKGTQYKEIGNSAEALIEANEIHYGLNFLTLLGSRKLHDRIHDTQPGSLRFYETKKVTQKTFEIYITRLQKFIHDHASDFNISAFLNRLRDCVVMLEEDDDISYFILHPNAIPQESMISFMDEVLIPTCKEDPYIMAVIQESMEDVYAHEYGHFLNNLAFKQELELTQGEESIIRGIYSRVHSALKIGERAQLAYSRGKAVDQVVSESLELNHKLIHAIASQLPNELRSKYLRFCKRRGLDEIATRAFTEIITGNPDHFGKTINNYAIDPFIYLHTGDAEITLVFQDLRAMGLAQLFEYLPKKLEEADLDTRSRRQ